MISCFVKHNCIYRATKRNNKNNSDKNTSISNSHTVILKNTEESEYQNSKFNNNGNNSYEIKPKTYKMKDLVALPSMIKIRTNI